MHGVLKVRNVVLEDHWKDGSKSLLHTHWGTVASSWVFYFMMSCLVILVVFIHPPKIFSGDTDTARNYLNTIVSSLSTILALCISIILVAIQLTASNYTHRVLDLFVRLPFNGMLFTFYFVTIMHSFFLMARISDPVRDPLPEKLQPEMSADLVLVVICFVSLLIYMYAVVQLLKPERIINLILRDYNRAFVRGEWNAALENVEQICDIAKRTSSVSDSVTGMRCVEAMLHISSRLPLSTSDRDPINNLHKTLIDQWVEIFGVTVKERETGMLYGVLDALHQQGDVYIKQQAWSSAEMIIKAYRHLVFSHLLSEGQVFYVERVVERLYRLAKCAAEQGERGQVFCLRTWQIIRVIGENVFMTQMTTVSSLVEAFLMGDALQSIFQSLVDSGQRARCSVIYFELWKSFAIQASVRDAARWATWWSDTLDHGWIKQSGRVLSVLLSKHVGREDIAKTLCYIWELSESDLDWKSISNDFEDDHRQLFDGWPVKATHSGVH